MVDECATEPAPNVYWVVFKEQEANYLAGYEAALSSATGKVGTIASSDIPYMHRYSDSFAQGTRLARAVIAVASPRRPALFRPGARREPGRDDAGRGRRSHPRCDRRRRARSVGGRRGWDGSC